MIEDKVAALGRNQTPPSPDPQKGKEKHSAMFPSCWFGKPEQQTYINTEQLRRDIVSDVTAKIQRNFTKLLTQAAWLKHL